MPRKMASRKKAKPSSENGRPKMGPAWAMNVGQRRPSSKDSTVPDTAPTAKRIAVPLAQRMASLRKTGFPVFSHMPSAMAIITGMVMPATEKRMWKASDIAICARAARRSDRLVAVDEAAQAPRVVEDRSLFLARATALRSGLVDAIGQAAERQRLQPDLARPRERGVE